MNDGSQIESLTIKKGHITAEIRVFSGLAGEFYISYSPSLNVTGYGESPKEALDDFKYNMDVFAIDLVNMKKHEITKELKSLGWEPRYMFDRQFSKSFIDQDGVLKNFDKPTEVLQQVLQLA